MDISGILASLAGTAAEHHVQIRSVYVSGSYANGYFLDRTSDLDLLLLVDHAPAGLAQLLTDRAAPADVELDLCILEVSALYRAPDSIQVRESVLSSKLCGRLLWGEDLLKDWALPPVEDYTGRTVEMVFEFIRRAHGASCDMGRLAYPDPGDPYMGYLVMRGGRPSTKQIISLYTWIATARLAKYHGVYCGCKKDCMEQAARHLDGPFAAMLREVYEDCRKNWNYTIPQLPAHRRKLMDYCRALLKFEQDFADEFYMKEETTVL